MIVDGGYEQEGYPRGQLQLTPICSLRETEKFIMYLTGVENDHENQSLTVIIMWCTIPNGIYPTICHLLLEI